MCGILRWICTPALTLAWTLALILGLPVRTVPNPGDNPASASSTPEPARVAFSHRLPPLDGSKLRATVVEVNYGPGEASTPHTHPCPVVGYVLEGDLRTQVAGGPVAVYHPGETFYEAPNGIHLVSANASTTEPTKFLAFFVCDNDQPLSSPAPAPKSRGAR
jgi:quercetin dioxygenase-like cupin family protein